MPVVTSGQMTIVDHNDAKPITAVITASQGNSQVYSKEDNVETWLPHYPTNNNILTAKVYAGSTSDIAAQLTNRKWSIDLGASLGSGTTLTLSTNLTSGSVTYYFEGDYTDPITGLQVHIIAQITIQRNQIGTNAVLMRVRGIDVIEASNSATKNIAQIAADVVRVNGVDDAGITYRWYKQVAGAWQQIDANFSAIAEFGFRTTAQSNAGSGGGIGSNIPADGVWADVKEIFIREGGIDDIGFFKVEAKDAEAKEYQAFFSVYDISDPYACIIASSAGDKFQNGLGTTNLSPIIWNGDVQVADLTGWTFYWTLKDKTGVPAGFVDTSKTPAAKTITSHTTTVFTLSGVFASPPVAGDVVKVVKADGTIKYFEVASATNTTNATVTIKTTGITATYLTIQTSMTANEFQNGVMYVCTLNGAGKQGTRSSSAGATITVTGDEIDTKGAITCEATRP